MLGKCFASEFVLRTAAIKPSRQNHKDYSCNIHRDLRNIALLQRTLFAISASLEGMANCKVDTDFNSDSGTDFAERVRLNRQELTFDARFWRCYRMLHFIACRVLGGSERAEEAIGSCWRIAFRHPRRFDHEGEFRSWLLRVLIDEALVLLRESVPTPTPKVLCEPVPAQFFRSNDVSDAKGDIRTDD